MIFSYPHIVLIIFGPFIAISFLTTYLMSVEGGDVFAWFPYISDTGTKPPASCLFGQFLDLGAIMSFFLIYTRYLHLKIILTTEQILLNRLNLASLISGIISCLGLTVVGNFQETNVIEVHLIGAFMAFIFFYFYCGFQTFMAYKLSDQLYSSKYIFIFRLIAGSIATLNIIMIGIFGNIAYSKFDGKDKLKWEPTDGGYVEHVLSTTNEWCLAVSTLAIFISFTPDFKRIEIIKPKVVTKNVTPV